MDRLSKFALSVYRTLFARRFFYRWNRFVYHCGLRGLGINNFGENTSGERFFVQSVVSPLPQPLILDIGANVGDWSRLVLEANPASRIYAFEPNAKAFQKLSKIPKLHPIQKACGATVDRGVLYNRSDIPSGTHGSLDPAVFGGCQSEVHREEIAVTTIDEFLSEEGIPYVDLLKIDVEGYEHEVLEGARTSIAEGKIGAVQFEFNIMNVYRRRFYRDFLALLPNHTFFRLLPKGKIPLRRYDPALHELFAYQNLVAIPKITQP